ncbi:MBG domain-containing protein [Azorhizobium caulinodans]|nr:MBG domain-containing protein [Azorhizobium caulinodans]
MAVSGALLHSTGRRAAALLTSAAFVGSALPALAQTALPTSGSVVSGSAAISAPSATSVLITQTSRNAIINWGSFSVGAGNAVRFENGSGATLNRVTGLSPSQIDGSLSATGSVYLVNPNGITVGPTGQVTTGGSFIASTHDVSDADFNAGGAMTFRGSSTASVINYGSIGSLGGDVVLIARKVENAGTLTAPNGTVGLAAGYEVLVRDAALSDGKFVVKVGGGDTEAKTTGVIKAAEAELKANGGNVYALAGNTESLTKATGVASRGGRIFLTAGDGGNVTVTQKLSARAAASNGKAKGGEIRVSGGTVKVSGKLDAKGEGDAGGTIVVTGRDIQLAAGADLDASGATGGLVLVGGDYQGGYDATTKYLAEDVPTAATTTVEAGASIRVDGTAGAGGRAVVWSDGTTRFDGTISATATGIAAGGKVETSGHNLLLGDNVAISTLSEQGQTGVWLIDPYNVTISSSGSSNVLITVSGNPWSVEPTASGANLNSSTLNAYLSSTNVAITTNGAGSEAGNITVNAAVTWSAATTLSLLADASTGGVFINANISGSNANSGLVLSAGAGGISQAGGAVIQAGTLTATAANGGSVTLTNTGNLVGTLGTSSAAGSFAFTNGQALTVSGSVTTNGGLSLVTASGGLTINGALTDAHANSSFTLSAAGSLIIAKDVTFSGANAAASLTSGGSYSLTNGARVSLPDSGASLSINGTSYTLIHDVSALQGMTGSGNYALGNDIDASATASWNSGAGFVPVGVFGTAFSGTLAGLGHFIDGLTVNRPGTSQLGLFGYTNSATVRDLTLSNVSMSGSSRVGGLVGWADTSNFSNVHVTGTIAATQEAGGVAGWFVDSTLASASSAASVTVSANGAGGLVGYALYSGTISDSYTTGSVTGATYVGGLIGQTFSVTPLTLTNIYASGRVTGTNAGGLIGFDDPASPSSITLSHAYWDANSTGQASAFGSTSGATITGTATDVAAAPRTQSTYSGFDFSNTWVMIAGETRPMLRNEQSSVIATPAALQLMSQGLSASYKLGANIDMASALAVGSNGYYGGLWGASGFVPVGNSGSSFTGTFNGQGHTISGLSINRGGTNYVGLFGYTSGAAISNVTLAGGSITGNDDVGPLIGYMSGGSVSSASASTTVSGLSTNEVNTGGLIGAVDGGSVSGSSASGDVTGVGWDIGGLVGYLINGGTITQSYATGNVTGTGTGASNGYVGGLVGSNGYISNDGGTISQSYATGTVTGAMGPVGGLVGHNEGTITDAYATGRVIGLSGASNIGGFVGVNYVHGTITNAYSTGYVTGSSQVGGFAGYNNNSAAAITNAYWDTQTSGQSMGIAGGLGSATARTTAQLQGSLPAGFSSSIWSTGTNLYPYFGWRYSTTPVAVSGVAYSDAGSTVLSGETVTAVSGGGGIGSAKTGANGYYYILVTSSALASTGVLTYLDNGSAKGAAFSDAAGSNGIQNVAIYGTAAHVITGQSTLTATRTNYLATLASYADADLSFLSSSSFAPLTTTAGYGVYLNPTGSYTLNANLGSSGLLTVDSGGTLGVSGAVTLSAAGALTLADAVSWTTASSLALSTTSGGNISLGGAVTGTNGTLILNASGTATSSSAINVGTFNLSGGTWSQNAATLPSFAATNFVIGSGATFLRVTGGDGSAATPYQIADVYGLQGVGSASLLSQNFELVADIDASGTSNWRSGAGFNPIGDNLNNFLGSFDGGGHAISGLYVNNSVRAGLFGVTGAGATVRDLAVSGTANSVVAGMLAAVNLGTIDNVQTSGAVLNAGNPNAGSGYLGGLVGSNQGNGSILNSSSSASVTNSQANVNAGGLLGGSQSATASVSNSFATGTVTSTTTSNTRTAGLVASNAGTITGSYATGNVSGGLFSGGLVALNTGNISNSFARGAVSGDTYAGGLVGRSYAAISNSYATGNVTAVTFAGGLVGYDDGPISDSYSTGSVSGATYQGGLVGYDAGPISNSYSTGSVSGATYQGGFIGYLNSGSVTASFWNTTTSGTGVGIGGGDTSSGITGLTTAQMISLSTFTGAGWSIDDAGGTSSVWRIYDGYTMPLLRSFMSSLTVTGGSGSKTYDGSAASSDVGTLVYSPGSYTTSLVAGTAGYTASSANAGTYSGAGLRLAGLYSSQFGYDITFVSGTLLIDKASLTVTASDAAKTYDGLAYAGGNGVTYSGFVGSDTAASLGGTLTYGGTAQGAVNAGTYSLTAGGLTSGNYNISYTAGTLTVGTAALTVTANDGTKTYDGTAYSGGNGVTYNGFVGSDTAASLGGALTWGGTAQGAVNAGTYSLTNSGLTSSNYVITYAPGTLTVTPAALTVTANDGTKPYDGTAYSGGNGVTYSGFVGSDTVASLGGTLSWGGTAQGAVNAGSYSITNSGLTSANYAITYVPGTLTLTPAALTVAADAKTLRYGDALPALTYALTSGTLYGGDTLTGALATAASPTANVGTYGIGQGTLSASPNYAITYVGANVTVTPRPISVTANAQSMAYGDALPALTYSVGGAGLSNGDTLFGSLVTGASATANVGNYAITQGTLAASANYTLTYTGANLSVGARPITVSATNQSIAYGDALPALTYSVGGAGLANGDTLVGSLATGASATSNVGTYAITQGTLAASANYALTYIGGTVVVTPRPLAVIADNQSRTVGAANPAFTYVIGGRGLVNGDTLTGTLTSPADSNSPAGRYAILQGSLTAPANYALSYVPGTLTVIGTQAVVSTPQNPTFVETSVPDQVVVTLDTNSLISFIDQREGQQTLEQNSAPRLTSCGGTSSGGQCAFLPVPANLPPSQWLSFRSE